MRTNIDIDDKLMDYVMATGEFKTKREAVEAGLKLIRRRHAYAAIRAARGTLHWDDSDEAWARSRADDQAQAMTQAATLTQVHVAMVAPQAKEQAELTVCEPVAAYTVSSPAVATLPEPATGIPNRGAAALESKA
ncbi:MAG: hypothetical protein AUJ20_12990 [Comamonadaceae bacterium CG1_02_60_18]|nr:MAG: hypothetical protein AUJ20_12990 [Comamonadaceae bacterium CG1_02_60_18]PIQ53701.1 MAG: DUF2191 domain-containing protein [Comamonadaceae bacterium CG12_big_fil_rev_8_21_14_0_65_59_15]